MSKTSVICIVADDVRAVSITEALKAANFPAEDISVLFADKQGTHDFAHEQHTKAPEGATTGGVTGGVIGAALGWLIGVGALVIPGIGPFIAAGPIVAALSGAAVGGAVGGITGALIGLGIPEYEAKRYEGRLRSGNILIAVHATNSAEVRLAKELFRQWGAEDISSTSEAHVPRDERLAA